MEDNVLTGSPVAEGFAAAPKGCEADGGTVTLSRREYERLWNVDWYSPLVFDPEELELQLARKGLCCTDRKALAEAAHDVAYDGGDPGDLIEELAAQAMELLAERGFLKPLRDGVEDQARWTKDKGE